MAAKPGLLWLDTLTCSNSGCTHTPESYPIPISHLWRAIVVVGSWDLETRWQKLICNPGTLETRLLCLKKRLAREGRDDIGWREMKSAYGWGWAARRGV